MNEELPLQFAEAEEVCEPPPLSDENSSPSSQKMQAESRLPLAPQQGIAPSLEKPRLRAYLAMLVTDVAILLGVFYLVSAVYLGSFGNIGRLESGLLSAYVILPLYLTIALYNGTYSRRSLTEWQHGALKSLAAILLSAALLNVLAFLAKSGAEFSRLIFLIGLFVSAAAMMAVRGFFVAQIRKKWGPSALHRMVIHAGGPSFELPHAFHIDAQQCGLVPSVEDPHALDRLSKYLRNMDEVIISCREKDRKLWSEVLKGTGIHGEVVHQLSRELGAISVVHHDAVGISALKVSTGKLGIRARAAKRIFDIVFSAAALALLSPIMLVAAVAIKLEDWGPIFFVQRRMGRGNRFFNILKFRSMKEGDEAGNQSTSRGDDRVTKVGRIIRRTSMDELPQLINVLRGDMSMVGPRPHALGSKAGSKLFWEVDRKYWQRHGLRPGITGLAQVRGHRGATDAEEDLTNRLLADLEYMQSWSLWRDITILVTTLRVLVHDRAY